MKRSRPELSLAGLARDLRRVTGMTPGVTLREAAHISPEALERKLRDFADWYRRDCENRSQTVEQLISRALDDEANTHTTP